MGVIQYSKVLLKNLQAPEEPMKTYARSQSRGVMDIDKLAKHMAAHSTPFSKGTIKGILEDFVECTRELILDGWVISTNLGTFNVSLQSRGVCESVVDEETGKKPVFDARDIIAVNLRFTPGASFENMIADVEFKEVETLEKQTEHRQAKNKAIADGTYDPKDDSGIYGNSGGNGGGSSDDDIEIHE